MNIISAMRTAMTIAGSDSIGGAGIQADVKAMGALDVHATCVITAVTAQNTYDVLEIHPLPLELIELQFDSILNDCKINAAKTGMLYSPEITKIVAERLDDHEFPLIVDPVLTAGVGGSLAEIGLADAIKKYLLPLCELITPNKYEAEVLSGIKINNEYDATMACELIGKGGSSVYLKGGHMDTKNVTDYLYLNSNITKFEYPRLKKSGHGSGCTLSSFITANCANGLDMATSVLKSRALIQKSIGTQYAIGKGDDVVNPIVYLEDGPSVSNILDEVEQAATRIVENLPAELVSDSGINIAYAAPNAKGPKDIAAIKGRIIVRKGIIKKKGPAKLGVAEHLSFVILNAMKYDPDMRCVISLKYSSDTADIMEELGFIMGRFNRRTNNTIEALMDDVVKIIGKVPDVILDPYDKKEKLIRVFGKNPMDVLKKIETIF
jgi:hydroxymethylpyrimidine/phosphomethylpyrimidine kinase